MTILKNLSKRGLALFLVLTMCLSVMQVTAFAADEEDTGSDPITEQIPEATDEVTNETTDEVTDETADEVTNETTDEVTDETTDEVTDETTDEVTDETTDEVTDETTDEVNGETADETTDETVDETETVVTASLEDEAVVAFLAAVESMEALQAQEDPDPDEYLAAMQKVLDCYDALSEEQKSLLEEDRATSGEEGTYAEMIATLRDGVNALTEGDGEGDNTPVTNAAKVGETEYATLQEAIIAAQKDNIETVTLLGNVKENVTVTGEITLDLAGCTLEGTGTGTVLTINGGGVTLTGNGTITGGNGTFPNGGGVTVTGGGNFTMENGTITENIANANGGGVFVYNGTFTMNNGTISDNNGGNYGGGVYVYNYLEKMSAKFTMNGGTISGNKANGGGGVGAVGSKRNTVRDVVVINGGTISGNEANDGGGIGVKTEVTHSTSTGNELNRLVITGGTITKNKAVNYGGGVYTAIASASISNCSITDNEVTVYTKDVGSGGGMYLGGGDATLTNVTFTGNTANQGGGLFSDGTVTLDKCTITNNTARGDRGFGGGMRFGPTSKVTMTSGEITGNTAKQGGGVFVFGNNANETSFTMTGGKLYGNTSTNASGSNSADVYSENARLSLIAASGMGGTLNDKAITGWFWDGGGQYAWNAGYCVERNVANTTVKQCLIAAYKNEPVAMIVETGVEYTTLKDAFLAVNGTATVKLLKDVKEDVYQDSNKQSALSAGKTITLDLGNYTVNGYIINDGADFTITADEGGITRNSYAVANFSGTTTIAGGKFEGIKYSNYAARGIYVKAGTLNVTGGTVVGTNGANGIYLLSGTVNVSGGTVTGANGISTDYQSHFDKAINVSGTAKVIATGTASVNAGINAYDKTQLTIDGNAEITSTASGVNVYDNGTKVVINNGAITGVTYGISGNGTADGTVIEINGGSITSTNATAIYHPQVGDMTITGGTITGLNGVQYSGAGMLTISGGNIIATHDYTDFPQKAPEQNDGTVADGAALSIISRGSGWQSSLDEVMNVTITGGEFTSKHNSAISVYRISKVGDKWLVGEGTNLPSYLQKLTITGGIFTGNPEKGVLDIEVQAMTAKSITGGYFNQDIDAGAINYVDDGYASHPVEDPNGYYNVHKPDMINGYEWNTTHHWTGCRVDGCLENKSEDLHIFGEWVIDVEAQPGADGQRHRDCTVCGYRENDTFGLLAVSASNVTVTYDGQSHVVAPVVTLAGANVSGAAISVTYTDANGNSVSNPVNAGTYTAVITAALEGYTTAQNTAVVTINPRPLTVTTGSATVVYPAVAVNTEASITGTFAEGESATVTATGSQSGVGSSYNSYSITWGANTLAGNYDITAEEGTLTVNPAAVPVIPTPTPGGTDIPAGPTPLAPGGMTVADNEVPLAAPGLNSTDHIDYIKGYEDGTVRPEANITRAEVATIFFRLMTNEYRIENWSSENDFSDVESGAWYNNAISTATKAGLLKGYPDGSFLPGNSITRAEFATIAAGFASEEVTQRGRFSDIQGHWAEESIERAAAAGWIKGENGKFRPDAYITRAEVIVAVNRMLDRMPDADHLLDGMKTFVDNVPGMWYYADIQEATNSHEYERAEDGVSGIWTELKPDQDWVALEKEWANAADANVADVAGGLTGGSESEAEGESKTKTED